MTNSNYFALGQILLKEIPFSILVALISNLENTTTQATKRTSYTREPLTKATNN